METNMRTTLGILALSGLIGACGAPATHEPPEEQADASAPPPPAPPAWSRLFAEHGTYVEPLVPVPGPALAVGRDPSLEPHLGPIGLLGLQADGHLGLERAPIDLPIYERPGLAGGDVDGDGATELVALSNGTVWVIDPVTWTVETSWTGAIVGFRPEVAVHDLDGDGVEDIVLIDSAQATRVALGGAPLGVFPMRGLSGQVAQLDGDPALEISHPDGFLDGATLALEPGLLRSPRRMEAWMLDVDGDGRSERIERYYPTVVEDVATGARRYAIPDPAIDLIQVPPALIDLGRDGRTDLVLRRHDYTGRPLAVVEGSTGRPWLTLRPPPGEGGILRMQAWDADGDGHDELLTATGSGMTLLDTGTLSWRADDPMMACDRYAPLAADIDADGRDEAVMVSASDETRLVALDMRNGSVVLDLVLTTPGSGGWTTRVEADGDAGPEIALYAKGNTRYLDIVPGGATVVELADPNPGNHYKVAGSLDVDGDGLTDALVRRADGSMCVREGLVGPHRWCTHSSFGASTVGAVDLDEDGRSELLVGSRGIVEVLDPIDGSLRFTWPAESFAPYSRDGHPGILVASEVPAGVYVAEVALIAGSLTELLARTIPISHVHEIAGSDGEAWLTDTDGFDIKEGRAWSLRTGQPTTTAVTMHSQDMMRKIAGHWVAVGGHGLFAF